jgi:hypothetical protein
MENEKTQMLLELRKYVINAHNSLDGAGVALATIEQKKVAYTFTSIIKSIEEVLKDQVTFTND